MKCFFLIPFVLQLTSTAYDSSVCTLTPSQQGQQHAIPTVSDLFEAHIDCVIINKNMSTEIQEYFDFQANQGEVHQMDAGIPYWAYYSFRTNEFFGIRPDLETCTVQELSHTDQRFLFGSVPSSGKGHIFSAAQALHFGMNGTSVAQGPTTVRGIQVQSWYSCQYWQDMNATMNVTWYFTDPNAWTTSLLVKDVPVRAYVKGRRYSSGGSHDFEHIYDFIHFKPYIEDVQVFETPDGLVCPQRKNTKPFPKIAPAYSLTLEIVDNLRQDVRFMREWYDEMKKLTRLSYKPSALSNSPYGFRPLTEIHDFSTGVAYIIDDEIRNCSVVPIELRSFDNELTDPHHVRMRSAKEFFYLDSSNLTYQGVKKRRNVDTDSWIGHRTDYPRTSSVYSTWQWFFKSSDWTVAEEAVAMYQGGTPIEMSVNFNDEAQYTYNIYHFMQSDPNLLDFDVSACYVNRNRRKFDFIIPDDAVTLIEKNKEKFKNSVLHSLVRYAVVSPVRIGNLQVVYMDQIHIRFELLDVAPVKGDVTTTTVETPLNLASALFVQTVNSNKFAILVKSGAQKSSADISINAIPHTIQEYQYENEIKNASDSGFSAGAVGGLAVGMIVVGGGAGAFSSFVFFK